MTTTIILVHPDGVQGFTVLRASSPGRDRTGNPKPDLGFMQGLSFGVDGFICRA